jgi:hypothetical protein
MKVWVCYESSTFSDPSVVGVFGSVESLTAWITRSIAHCVQDGHSPHWDGLSCALQNAAGQWVEKFWAEPYDVQ